MNHPARLVLVFFLLVCGCGYSFQGTINTLPRDIRRVAIPTVKNSTTKTGLTNTLTNELIHQFTNSKILKVTNIETADTVLEAHIRAVSIEGGALSSGGRKSLSRRVIIIVSASLKRIEGGKVLWAADSIMGRRSYDVSSDQSTEESSVSVAMTKTAEDVAEKIHNSIFESF